MIYERKVTLTLQLVFASITHPTVRDVFPESPLNTDTRIIRTLWHVPLVSVLTGFHCTFDMQASEVYLSNKS